MNKDQLYSHFVTSAEYNIFKQLLKDIVEEKTEILLSLKDKEDIYKTQIEVNAIKQLETLIESKSVKPGDLDQ